MRDVTADGAAPQYTGRDPLSAGSGVDGTGFRPAAAPREGHDPIVVELEKVRSVNANLRGLVAEGR